MALRSKDRDTKLGCVIVGKDKEVRSMGYNGFVRGANDEVACRYERPEKYHWFEHAERNAIYNAARCGTPLDGCTAYIGLCPCIECTRALIQVGIKEIVVDRIADELRATKDTKWTESHQRSLLLLNEVGVKLRRVEVPF